MFEEAFICKCKNKFDLNTREPMVLECGHTFCKLCIEDIA